MGDFALGSKSGRDGGFCNRKRKLERWGHFERERDASILEWFVDGEKIWYNIANG